MTYQEIEHYVKSIRNYLKLGKLKEALKQLEKFIEMEGDSELEDDFIALSARYSKEIQDQISGTKNSVLEQNKIIRSITSLLRNTKEFAIEKATINAGKGLENLTDLGNQTIEKLKQINLLMARSRIIELEVMINGPTGILLSEEIKSNVKKDIKRLKEIIEE